MLTGADRRTRGISGAAKTDYGVTFEEYRHDALGRRIWVRSRKSCYAHAVHTMCNLSLVRRTVWDGDREFYEIQMPAWENTPASTIEGDLAAPKEDFEGNGYYDEDRNPFFGRVAYTYGHGIDRPLSVVRMGYRDFAMIPYTSGPSTWRTHVQPFAILPLWDAQGNIDGAVLSVNGGVDGGRTKCETWQSRLYCIKIDWPESFFAYERPRYQRWHWHGTLLEDKRNESGTYYRRNRTYDPSTGRFTQEDPIGLAGGLNVYGFAAGDPVNYSDPYGLCPERLRDSNGRCPGGLAVAEWRAVEGSTRYMTRTYATRVRAALSTGSIRGGNLPRDVYGEVRATQPSTIYINRTFSVSGVWSGSIFDNERELGKTLDHEVEHVEQLKGLTPGSEAQEYINANGTVLEDEAYAVEGNFVPPNAEPVCSRGICAVP